MLNIGPSDAPPFLVDDAGVLIGDDNADLLSVGS
jgi:hypothetical protein